MAPTHDPTRQRVRQLANIRARAERSRRGESAVAAVADRQDALALCDDMIRDLAGAHLECDRLVEALKQETATWERLFNTIPSPAIVTDVSGTIVALNTPAGGLLNASVTHLAGQQLLVYSEDRQAFLDLLQRLARGAEHVRTSLVLRPRERRRVAVDVTIAPLLAEHATAWIWFLTPQEEGRESAEARHGGRRPVRHPDIPTESGDGA